MADKLGDKLGPRLSRLFTAHQIAVRRQLAPIEARIAAAASQQVIDRAGREVADLYGPLVREALAMPELHPVARELIAKAASGDDQWQAVAGFAVGSSGLPSSLGTIMSNYLAPFVYQAVRVSPNLTMDVASAARSAAIGTTTYGNAVSSMANLGYSGPVAETYITIAQNWPSIGVIYDLYNRGIISAGEAETYLKRTGLPDQAIAPVLQLHRQLVSPADAALAVLRGNMTAAEGAAAARAAGVDGADFEILIGNTGEPPALEEMLMLWRRNEMDTATLDRGIRQSRVRDEWIPYIHRLAVEPPAQADVLESLVQGEISTSEALKRYEEAGGDPTFFETAFHTRANSPSPTQLAEMLNRGIIPAGGTGPNATSWLQGFYEGRWKDKWAPAFKALTVYHPPPREIATLVREGGMNQNQAESYWRQAGMTPELAHTYWVAAHYQRTSKAHELAQSEITRLYTDKAISRNEALSMLTSVNWAKTDAEWILDIADLQRERQYLERAIAKISSLFVAHKIPAQAAKSGLAALGVAASEADHLVTIWALERAANVKTLTAAEITDAWFYQAIGIDEAQALLEQLGYSAHDAGILLVIKAKGQIAGYTIPGG